RTTFPSVFDYSNQLFYWDAPRSRQLNFAVRLNKYLPVDVKYQNRISSDDAKPVIDFQKAGKSTSGLILTKDTLATKSSHLEVPVHLALLLIKNLLGRGPSRATAFSSPFRKLLSRAGQGGICVRNVVTLGSGF